MADSDEDSAKPPIKAKSALHGSLASIADKIIDGGKMEENTGENGIASTKSEQANIHVSTETMELDKFVDPHKEAMLAEFERRKRARQLTLPTDDIQVKLMLRRINQPICLFGEDKPDRRERLRLHLSNMDEQEAQRVLRNEEAKPEKPKEDNTTWYHPGSEELRQARIFIAQYSLPKAKQRLEAAKQFKAVSTQLKAIKTQERHKWIRGLTNQYSQIGDTRPVSHCQFSPDSKLLATAAWSGQCKLWSVPDCQLIRTYRGPESPAGCVTFHPKATLNGWSPSIVNLASCAQDGSVLLWDLEHEDPLADIDGHQPYRVSKLAFHPSGRFLATCCFDHSWRLYDLEANDEVLFQEGHSKPVFDISFQCDGSLALTGGLDCYGRVWDLRTGRCVMFLEGHQKPIHSVQFSPEGYRMATGSDDNTCKIWDLRVRRLVYTVPVHSSLVSAVRFDPAPGNNFMLTASYDKDIKLWTNPDWQPLRTLAGHGSRVMCADISPDGKYIASTSSDGKFKIWAPDDVLSLS